MKKTTVIVSIAAVVFLAAGCDFVRATLGKPTSQDIQNIRDSIAAAEQARIDSAIQAQKMLEEQERLAHYSGLPAARYNIVAGSFKDSANAVSLMETMAGDSIDARLLKLRNGFIAVTVFATDSSAEAKSRLRDFVADTSYRYEACIYDARRELEDLLTSKEEQTIQTHNQ